MTNRACIVDNGQWGGVGVSYSKPEFVIYKNYYVYKQYTAFIRPNSTILAGLPTGHLGAAWPGGKVLVVVSVNNQPVARPVELQLIDQGAEATTQSRLILTDATHNATEVPGPTLHAGQASMMLRPYSVQTLLLGVASSLADI